MSADYSKQKNTSEAPHLNEDDYRSRALLQFASEEAKHIHLFRKFAEEFKAGFVTNCETIGPPEEIGKAVLAHSPLGVALVILGIEWMTQEHYLESVHDDENLDPQFKSLLRHHWVEEAQYTKLDTLMVQALTDNISAQEIEKGISDYTAIGALIDGGIPEQVRFDTQALQRAAGRNLSKAEEDQFRAVQTQAQRWTYLGSAMTHPKFLQTVGEIVLLHELKSKRCRALSVEISRKEAQKAQKNQQRYSSFCASCGINRNICGMNDTQVTNLPTEPSRTPFSCTTQAS